MSGDTHAAVGAATSLGIATVTDGIIFENTISNLAVGVMFAVAGALLADVDVDGSKANKTLKTIGVLASIFFIAILFVSLQGKIKFSVVRVLAILALLAMSFYGSTRPHREATHSIVFCLATSVCIFLATNVIYAIWFSVGYASHLLVDLLNGKGESLLWPLKGKFCLKLCSASGVVNDVLKYLSLGLAMFFFVVCAMKV